MRMDVPGLDVASITAAVEARAAATCGDDLALAARTLRRLPPARWALEWQLPWWLGHAWGLEPEIAEALVVSNVLGLVAIRLRDDVDDGEVPEDEVEAARRVSAALFDAALDAYRDRFEATSPIWPFLDRTMAEFRDASEGRALPAERLGSRAAPLRVGAFAVCLLSSRSYASSGLKACLDRALAALVRYDQLCDWEADLDAGRWNSFVASQVDRPQDPDHRAANRSAVLAALMTRRAARTELGLVAADSLAGARLAGRLGCAPLAEFLSDNASRATRQGEALEAHYRTAASTAAQLFFGGRIGRTRQEVRS
jgi:hypothetical protein